MQNDALALQVEIYLRHKVLGGNYKPVFRLKDINLCKIVKRKNDPQIGFMRNYLKVINMTLSGAIHECPYRGKFRVVNGGIDHTKENYTLLTESIQLFPNGYYILTARSYNKNDSNIGSFTIYFDSYFRQNHLDGYESL